MCNVNRSCDAVRVVQVLITCPMFAVQYLNTPLLEGPPELVDLKDEKQDDKGESQQMTFTCVTPVVSWHRFDW